MVATNEDRADWGRLAVLAFADVTKLQEELCSDEREEVYVDLICDLMHDLDRQGIDPAEVLNKAIAHHDHETNKDYGYDGY